MRIKCKSILLISLLLFTGCTYSCETNKHREQVPDSKVLKKLSLELSTIYKKNKDASQSINVIVKTTAPLTKKQIEELSNQSIHINTISGNIFTADIKIKDILPLAEKDYVEYIELSRELRLLKP